MDINDKRFFYDRALRKLLESTPPDELRRQWEEIDNMDIPDSTKEIHKKIAEIEARELKPWVVLFLIFLILLFCSVGIALLSAI